MRRIQILPLVLGTIAGMLAVTVLLICFTAHSIPPVLLSAPEGAAECAREMMDKIYTGDYIGASDYLYGKPSLSAGAGEGSGAAKVIWDAFLSSLSCRSQGELYADENGLAQDYILSGLDIPSLLQQLKATAPGILQKKVEASESLDQIYDDNWQYREDLTQAVLEEAARQAAAGGSRVERSVTLRLVYEDDRWWVLPNQELIAAISGGLA